MMIHSTARRQPWRDRAAGSSGPPRTWGSTRSRVHTDLDRSAPHVHDADEAVAVESYLDIDAVIAAARAAGAEAIHPGYGFLSERSAFARAVEDAGLTLVGPSAQVMEQMGRKDAARAVAEEAGVAVVPSYDLSAAPSTVRLPRAGQGGGGRRRQGHAHRPLRRRVRRGVGRRAARGEVLLR